MACDSDMGKRLKEKFTKVSPTNTASAGEIYLNNRHAAEFFAGIGLVRTALEQAGWSVAFANDIAPKKFHIYRDNFGAEDFRLGDIQKISGSSVPTVALATASFPCIDLSLAGNRSGLNGQHSSAYWEFHRILKEMRGRRPPLVLLENVVGLLSSNGGQDIRNIVKSLGRLGYYCDLLLVDAVRFIPQSRPRLFLIASVWPQITDISRLPPHEARPHAVSDFIKSCPQLPWSHTLLPPLPARKQDLCDLVQRFKPSSPLWWDSYRQRHLYRQMSKLHKLRLAESVKQRRTSFATVYKRVRPSGCRAEVRMDGIAGCLRTPRGGSSKQFLIQAGYGKWRVRNLTAREYARLQGVSDSFQLNVPYNQALYGFGDAVCVPAVEWVIKYAINPMLA